MSKQTSLRKYGKQSRKAKSDRLFVELPQTPVRSQPKAVKDDNLSGPADFDGLTSKLSTINLQDENFIPPKPVRRSPRRKKQHMPTPAPPSPPASPHLKPTKPQTPRISSPPKPKMEEPTEEAEPDNKLQVLSWPDICPTGDKIVKIAEASYAEVYRVTNERGTSIIKVIRMESPIKAQTKAQRNSGLVDEEPHSESDLIGELKISEWLADIPGFVVYKERYLVQGKACKELLETHQAFHKRIKRQDPDRLQFYPSPSRYLDDTKFLVVELGDAGTALEDFQLDSTDQLWDIFFHVAIALARAEAHIEFEHRDLHEGNLCIRKTGDPIPAMDRDRSSYFGFSGLEVTILDYGLSRAHADSQVEGSEPIAYDLERDLSLFTSEHAPQCEVYRRMRSFFLRGDRVCLPPQDHKTAYEDGLDGPIAWAQHEPYTNVLWLAYIYEWITNHFKGTKKQLNAFKRLTKELWLYLNPNAEEGVPSFGSASEVVQFALESGWIEEGQLLGVREDIERSILSILANDNDLEEVLDGETDTEPDGETPARRSPKRRQRNAV
ncbi:uncharacterized protein F4807DRAFT_438439 [Annulohypoxylon truncatum]|uniref:uncharacterized protein n=1 Tax=Annulohypoxylon truncatum TaxID=327061 RepID=UPI0020079577|nr:uncharacterized protein F4807DRAFT_438439 [Annulohypoxylon truncatum]KAI1206557.1 hypothetical protein F4807DRAFT_438439 [Annulohypoxylon truncatum]